VAGGGCGALTMHADTHARMQLYMRHQCVASNSKLEEKQGAVKVVWLCAMCKRGRDYTLSGSFSEGERPPVVERGLLLEVNLEY
jgi:hypothetical protein